MKEEIKNRIILLVNSLISGNNTNMSEEEIGLELDELCQDPLWSDYIFWSDEYINDDGSVNFEKFFEKIFTDKS